MLEWLSTVSITELVGLFITAPLEQFWVGISLIFGLTTSNQYTTLIFGGAWGLAGLIILVGHMSTGAEIVFTLLKDPHSVRHPSLITLFYPHYISMKSFKNTDQPNEEEEKLLVRPRNPRQFVNASSSKDTVLKDGIKKEVKLAVQQEALPFFFNFDVAIYYVILSMLTGVISAVISPPLLFILFICKGLSMVSLWILLHINLNARPLPSCKRIPVLNTIMALGNLMFEFMIGPSGIFPIAKYQDELTRAE